MGDRVHAHRRRAEIGLASLIGDAVVLVGGLPTDHRLLQRVGGGVGRRGGVDEFPVFEHVDAVGDLQHLVEFVRDEDERRPVAQVVHEVEQDLPTALF